MIIARAIDQKLGRRALTETVANGVDEFYHTYIALSDRDSSLPKLSEWIAKHISSAR
jgi:hypothetical protein